MFLSAVCSDVLTTLVVCHSQLSRGTGNYPVLSVGRGHASSRQQVLDQRRKLKDAGFSDAQADTILTVTEALAPVTQSERPVAVTKSGLDYLRTESRIFVFILVCVTCLSAPTGSPVGDFVQGIFGPVADSDVALEKPDVMKL